jgi:hypothetical protein
MWSRRRQEGAAEVVDAMWMGMGMGMGTWMLLFGPALGRECMS